MLSVNNDIRGLIDSVNDGSTSAFMWEWFTTKPFVDAEEARFVRTTPFLPKFPSVLAVFATTDVCARTRLVQCRHHGRPGLSPHTPHEPPPPHCARSCRPYRPMSAHLIRKKSVLRKMFSSSRTSSDIPRRTLRLSSPICQTPCYPSPSKKCVGLRKLTYIFSGVVEDRGVPPGLH